MKITEASMTKMHGVNLMLMLVVAQTSSSHTTYHMGEIQYCLTWPKKEDSLACKDASQRGVAGKLENGQNIVMNT